MITRAITLELETLLGEYPVVTILGPRQAGKTTLARHGLEGFAYSNLESPEVREFARADPRAYLAQFREQVIIDEIQHVPELLSYLQVQVDENPRKGRFILTGSHQLEVRQAITQSLAGRTAILNLLPLSIAELAGAGDSFRFVRGIRPPWVPTADPRSGAASDHRLLELLPDLRGTRCAPDCPAQGRFLV